METNAFTHASDSGHGWLRVPLTTLMQLKIDWAISDYSYVETTIIGDIWWLEEDADATLFIEAYRAKHGRKPLIRERDDGDYSPIRNLRHVQQIAPVPLPKVLQLLDHFKAKADAVAA